ncbi:MAG: hypothetical protein PGN07_04610 [Aeromicrobium erythreum]
MTLVDTNTGEVIEALSTSDRSALERHEAVIAAGLETFVEVGQALATIRDDRLYRSTHETFEAYCRERWGMDRRHANRTIEAAEVVGSMDPNALKPTNVRQARELRSLPPEQAAEAMRTAHESTGGKVTAKAIREARAVTAERLSAGYVKQFPALSFFHDRGEYERVNGLGRDLAAMDENERAMRLGVLDKTIAYEQRKERGEEHPPAHATLTKSGSLAPITPVSSDTPKTPSPEPRGEAGSGEGHASSEPDAPADRPTISDSIAGQLTALRNSAIYKQRVEVSEVRDLADALHDFADDLEAHDAQQ